MADSYHIIDGKVVPYSGGRKCNDTDAWRDATPLELQLQEQLAESERATAAQAAEIEALRAEVSGLRAARIAYANEFPATEDGDPDTGNIHANIRALKARAERLAEALREWWSAHRPVGWTEDQHRARPYVNLITVADKALTEALLRDQEASND